MEATDGRKEKTKRERAAETAIPDDCKRALSLNQVATLLDFVPRQIRAMISAGEYPRADFVLGNRPRWLRETHNGWMDQQVAQARKD